MKTIERNNCLVTGNKGVLEHLHTFKNFPIFMGCVEEMDSSDNDSNKWGKRLNGSELLVQSPEIIGKYDTPLVILRAGAFQEEISSQLKRINSSVIIVS
jgi:hypothetical protein